jgi:hypothetical protein
MVVYLAAPIKMGEGDGDTISATVAAGYFHDSQS